MKGVVSIMCLRKVRKRKRQIESSLKFGWRYLFK